MQVRLLKKHLKQYHTVPFNFKGICKVVSNEDKTKDLCHLNYKDLKDLFKINLDLLKNTFYSFCVVREPISRFKSAYIQYTTHSKFQFNELPFSIEEIISVLIKHNDISNDARYVHFLPQTYFTHTDDDKLIVDEIFTINNLFALFEKLGIVCNFDVSSTENESKTKDEFFEIELSTQQLEQLRVFYERDYKLLSTYF